MYRQAFAGARAKGNHQCVYQLTLINHSMNNSIDGEGLLNTAQLASKANVHKRSISNWVRQKKIPCIRIPPRCVRYKWRDVEKALAKFTVKEAA